MEEIRNDLSRIHLTGKTSAIHQVMEFLRRRGSRDSTSGAKSVEMPTQRSQSGLTIHPDASKEDIRSALSYYLNDVAAHGTARDSSRSDDEEFNLPTSANVLLRRGRTAWALNRFRSSVLPSLIADLANEKLSEEAKNRLQINLPRMSDAKLGDNKSNLYTILWERIADFFVALEDSSSKHQGLTDEVIGQLKERRR